MSHTADILLMYVVGRFGIGYIRAKLSKQKPQMLSYDFLVHMEEILFVNWVTNEPTLWL